MKEKKKSGRTKIKKERRNRIPFSLEKKKKKIGKKSELLIFKFRVEIKSKKM